MKELELYKFVQSNYIEISWRGDELLAWIPCHTLAEFCDFVGNGIFEEGGVDCTLLAGAVVCVNFGEICDYFGIDPEDILKKDE